MDEFELSENWYASQRHFDKAGSYCRCGREVTNAAFFKKSSSHFKGTCKPERFEKIPERTVDKPMPYPWPPGFHNPFPGQFLKPWPQESDKWLTMPRQAWRDARWITALFAGQCAKCSTKIEANQKAFYNKSTRKLLCESAECGKRAARERYSVAA